MQLADTLSRAASNLPTMSDLEQELETVCAMEQSKIVDPLIQGVAEATAEDPDLREVLSLIRHGWPNERSRVLPAALPYFSIREE